ncbi:hypothetical protein [Saccharibacillus alkalitolerans]|uniref:DUF2178 domain-containing protein n=1 Tax=Saccharibacillus alkalitolerans TaxID=2705290 RepID=A0ABX0F2F0_9BACL|nr:hypothetical protein [Saccharibacillus alkalitolerans]NGZ75173.1 hypothetical protein [Saccharibacillus alkalitolerans]
MKTKKILGWISGSATLIVIGYTLYKMANGQQIGSSEIYAIGITLSMFFSAIAWGHKGEDDGVRQDEELGRRISERSGMIGYYVLLVLLFLSVIGERYLYDVQSPWLLILLAVGIFLHPMIEFLQTRKYR